jgi:putative NADH-flavin reductase
MCLLLSPKAIVLGATGATGESVLKQLLESNEWSKVTAFVRRDLGFSHPKLNQLMVADFGKLEDTKGAWEGHDVVFNCIGTTRGQVFKHSIDNFIAPKISTPMKN